MAADNSQTMPSRDVTTEREPLAGAPKRGAVTKAVRQHLGSELRALYASVLTEEQPSALLDLIARLTGTLAAANAAGAEAFQTDLLAALPGLRAFALSLAVNPAVADDLVQETLLKAWKHQGKFQPGTNLQAWLCTILRNQFYSEIRKRKREVEDADGVMAGRLVAPAAQEASSDLQRVKNHLAKLPAMMREALLLVGAQGMTYEDAAELLGCQVGTVKSRVSRARNLLANSLRLDSRRAAV
jgi:RNA polymerase sigma-70 factor (ECF subfamily)